MKIGVLSDTHIPGKVKTLPDEVIQAFKNVDHIIHAGDIISLEVIELLETLSPVTAVSGNIDPEEVQAVLGSKEILNFNGYRIGITHGHGKSGKTIERAIKCFESDKVDCIVFGHSHIPYCEYINSVLMFNPGSPTDKRRNKFFSIGMIEISNEIRANHIYFSAGTEPNVI